jgi:hypothetical protein
VELADGYMLILLSAAAAEPPEELFHWNNLILATKYVGLYNKPLDGNDTY